MTNPAIADALKFISRVKNTTQLERLMEKLKPDPGDKKSSASPTEMKIAKLDEISGQLQNRPTVEKNSAIHTTFSNDENLSEVEGRPIMNHLLENVTTVHPVAVTVLNANKKNYVNGRPTAKDSKAISASTRPIRKQPRRPQGGRNVRRKIENTTQSISPFSNGNRVGIQTTFGNDENLSEEIEDLMNHLLQNVTTVHPVAVTDLNADKKNIVNGTAEDSKAISAATRPIRKQPRRPRRGRNVRRKIENTTQSISPFSNGNRVGIQTNSNINPAMFSGTANCVPNFGTGTGIDLVSGTAMRKNVPNVGMNSLQGNTSSFQNATQLASHNMAQKPTMVNPAMLNTNPMSCNDQSQGNVNGFQNTTPVANINELLQLAQVFNARAMQCNVARGAQMQLLAVQKMLCGGPVLSNIPVQFEPSLRPIIIDGSNVARSHGSTTGTYSCRGIAISIEYFLTRGHKQVTALFPEFNINLLQLQQMTDLWMLQELAKQKLVVFTPSQTLTGMPIPLNNKQCCVDLSFQNGGVIVSNENFQDIVSDIFTWRQTVEKRLVMYFFNGNQFTVPNDPVGPLLKEVLSFPGV